MLPLVLVLSLGVLLVACTGGPSTPDTTATPLPMAPGLHTYQLPQEGSPIPYWVYLPAHAEGTKLPLLLLLHDGREPAFDFLRRGGLLVDAAQRGYIIVLPGPATITNPATLIEMTDQVAAMAPVNSARLLLAGIGAGGDLAQRMLLLPSHPFAAVASMDASIVVSDEIADPDRVIEATPLMLTFGQADATHLQHARAWAALFGCGTSMQARNEFVEQVGWYGCRNRAEIIYQIIDGLDGWTGSVVSNTTGRAGVVSLTNLVWQFFNKVAPEN